MFRIAFYLVIFLFSWYDTYVGKIKKILLIFIYSKNKFGNTVYINYYCEPLMRQYPTPGN